MLGQQDSTSKKTDSFSNKINYIRCAAIEDKAGNLWFGTSGNGIFRYDGNTSTHFTMKDGLLANNVQALYEDSKGRIWVSSGKKICYYNGDTFIQVTVITPDSYHVSFFLDNTTPSQNKSISIFGICEDKNGNIWFSALDDGVYCYDGKTVTHFQIEGVMQSILTDNEKNIWFNFTRYDGKSFTIISPYGSDARPWVPQSMKDKEGNLWFAVRLNGFYRYDGKKFTNYSDSNNIYRDPDFLFEDKSGKLWAGGNYSSKYEIWLSWFDGKIFHQATGILNTKEFMNNYARPVVGDKDGNIWISAGDSIFRYDGKSLTDFTEKVFVH